jgi:phage tail sheath protein FI
MPVSVSYPGVYIEEIPSGVRTIVGVSTSVAAFLGRAASGSINKLPVEVNGIGEFERLFGPVSPVWPMSLAVRDFFQNGGSRAIVVRLFKGTGGEAELTAGGLKLQAASPGKWGEALRAEVDVLDDNDQMVKDLKSRLGIQQTDKLFNLDVTDTRPGGRTEQHRSLTLVDSVRRLDRILEAESSLVRWTPVNPLPALADGKDVVSQKEEALKEARKNNPPDSQAVKDAVKAVQDAITAMKAGEGSDLDEAAYLGNKDDKTGLYALEKTDFNLLCIPPDKRGESTPDNVYGTALTYCVERRAMLIVDPPHDWTDIGTRPALLGKLTGPTARNAAIYFPRILQSEGGELVSSVPCGAIAGIMARTDAQRGVWKAPAGVDANLAGVDALTVRLTDEQNGRLNNAGINGLRTFPVTGNVVWGARTMRGANQLGDEYKYIPVRRLALFLEESLYRGTKWVVFEPNDEPLWAQIRLNVGAFLQGLFRQGAFQGRSPREAYFVKCDKDTTTQNDINLGIVNVLVGFAPLKPAEFVIIKIQQLAGQIEA